MKSPYTREWDPYQILFPCGIVTALMGVGLWVGFQYDAVQFYPRQAHANIMYFGFLWAFVVGFLMTAIPKMTNTQKASAVEVSLAVIFVCLQVGLNFYNALKMSVFIFFVQSVFLLGFVAKRWFKTRRVPFEGFIFLPFAFLQAFLAVACFFYSEKTSFSFSLDKLYLLAGEAFILNLVLGLGSRLIPVLSRVPNALSPTTSTPFKKYLPMILLVLILNLGFWIQAGVNAQLGYFLRLGVVVMMSHIYFQVFQKKLTKSFVGFGLRCGLIFIMGSYFLSAFHIESSVATQHLLYVGGFVLITFMVGTRVMLAHGGQNLDYETTSVRIGAVALLMALASLLRLYAGAQIQGNTMKLGIFVFALAVALWSHKFLSILMKTGK